MSTAVSKRELDRLQRLCREILGIAEKLGMLANVSALDVHTPNAEIRRIQKVVAEFMGVPLSSMLSKDKVREVVFARQVAMTLCGDLVPIGAREIARNFRSDTDPGTVRFARSRVQEECKINPVFNKMYQELKEKLKHE